MLFLSSPAGQRSDLGMDLGSDFTTMFYTSDRKKDGAGSFPAPSVKAESLFLYCPTMEPPGPVIVQVLIPETYLAVMV